MYWPVPPSSKANTAKFAPVMRIFKGQLERVEYFPWISRLPWHHAGWTLEQFGEYDLDRWAMFSSCEELIDMQSAAEVNHTVHHELFVWALRSRECRWGKHITHIVTVNKKSNNRSTQYQRRARKMTGISSSSFWQMKDGKTISSFWKNMFHLSWQWRAKEQIFSIHIGT